MSTSLWIALAAGLGLIVFVTLRLLSRGRRMRLPEAAATRATFDEGPATSPPRADVHIDKNVQFTVYRPTTILPDKEYTLLAFAHLSKRRADAPKDEPDPVKEVQRLATKILSDQPAQYEPAKLDRGFSIPRQGFLLFMPAIEGCQFNPPTQSVQWLNSVQKVEFGMTASADVDGREVEGQMTVYLGATYLTEIPIRITVDSKFVVSESQQGVFAETSAEPYRKIFASYSRKDTKIVEDFEAYVAALGDEYLRDVRDIRAGEIWSEKLEQLIREASVFQLFWSSNSMTSEFVKQEWEYALGLNREKFIRPVYWEDPRPERKPDLPPPLLDRLEFHKFPMAAEEEHAAVPPVWIKQGGESATTQGQSVTPGTQAKSTPETRVRGGDSLSLRLRGNPVKHFVSMVAFATVAASVFVGHQNSILTVSFPECPECPQPTPTDTRGIGPSPLPSPLSSPRATPVVSPNPSPTSSVDPTPAPSPQFTPTPSATPTPTPFNSSISVKIDPAVFSIRRNIGTYVVAVNNEGSGVIRRVLLRQTLRKDVKYVSSDPPTALQGQVIVLSADTIAVKGSTRFSVTIRKLGEVKPGESYVPQHTIVTYLDIQGKQHKYSP